MKKYKSKSGLSVLLAIGSYGGFHATCSSSAFHFCIGWIGFTIFFYDAENAMGQLIERNRKKDESIKKIKDISLREEIINAWMDGNKKGWEMSTDWPESATEYYRSRFGIEPTDDD